MSSWQTFALCGDDAEDPEDWDMSAIPRRKAHAVAVCRSCPVYGECLTEAQRKPPVDLIQAAFGWRLGSREPVDPMTGKRLTKATTPKRATKSHGYSGYANGCRCPVCLQGKRDYVASRKSA